LKDIANSHLNFASDAEVLFGMNHPLTGKLLSHRLQPFLKGFDIGGSRI